MVMRPKGLTTTSLNKQQGALDTNEAKISSLNLGLKWSYNQRIHWPYIEQTLKIAFYPVNKMAPDLEADLL